MKERIEEDTIVELYKVVQCVGVGCVWDEIGWRDEEEVKKRSGPRRGRGKGSDRRRKARGAGAVQCEQWGSARAVL